MHNTFISALISSSHPSSITPFINKSSQRSVEIMPGSRSKIPSVSPEQMTFEPRLRIRIRVLQLVTAFSHFSSSSVSSNLYYKSDLSLSLSKNHPSIIHHVSPPSAVSRPSNRILATAGTLSSTLSL